jgi:hypothetical protein
MTIFLFLFRRKHCLSLYTQRLLGIGYHDHLHGPLPSITPPPSIVSLNNFKAKSILGSGTGNAENPNSNMHPLFLQTLNQNQNQNPEPRTQNPEPGHRANRRRNMIPRTAPPAFPTI